MSGDLRTALVTGASRGIGRGVATRLALRGYGLTITARDAATLEELAVELRDAGSPKVVVQAGDAASTSDTESVVAAHLDAFTTMSALVLAAGVGSSGSLEGYPLTRWDKQLAVNATSAFLAVREALPALRADAVSHPGRLSRVVALASIGGVHAEPGLAAYGASKAALLALCRSINAEESGRGVAATALAPAYVDTDMSAWVHEQVPPEAMIPVEDVVGLVDLLIHLAGPTVISEVVMARAGTTGYCA